MDKSFIIPALQKLTNELTSNMMYLTAIIDVINAIEMNVKHERAKNKHTIDSELYV